MGRLFDAVASLLDLRHEVTFEAQAAMQLEASAMSTATATAHEPGAAPSYRFEEVGDVFSAAPVLAAIVDDLQAGRHDPGAIAVAFHDAVAALVAEVAARAAASAGLHRVGLTGGVFQNVLLLRRARAALASQGLDVLTHRLVPPNDGGIALGQAAVAACRLTSSTEPAA